MSERPSTQPSNEDIVRGYETYLMPIWKQLNVPIRHATGCHVEDFDGNEYLDLFSGISVTNAGHGNEAVTAAAREQLDEFVHGCTYVHPHEPALDLAETLAEITPGRLQKSFLCNSGTEAVEGAIKLARKYTGSKEVVALEMGFHGRTLGSLSLTGNRSYKADMGPVLNDTAHAAAPYGYRCPRCQGEACGAACAEDIAHVIDSHTSGDVAAIVVEPIMGEGGIIPPRREWLARVAEIARERDALFIADEVQSGFGRTGRMWGVDHFDVEPDIVTQAKGIANGLPLGAFTAPPEIAEAFEPGDHLSTFGGNPVTCAAALASIEELRGGLIENADDQGEWLADRLATLEEQFDVVGETRGLGLMQGAELVNPETLGPMNVAPAPDSELASAVATKLRKAGIIVGVGGFYKNVLRIQPPLSITAEELEPAVEELEAAISSCQ